MKGIVNHSDVIWPIFIAKNGKRIGRGRRRIFNAAGRELESVARLP